jgi:predicted kinase
MADRVAAHLVQLQCTAPAALAEKRIRRRADSLSDAYPGVAARMAQSQAPWPDAVTIDTGSSDPGEQDPARALRQALDAIGRPEARA